MEKPIFSDGLELWQERDNARRVRAAKFNRKNRRK